ncbi:MAG: tetratricopeptide repeat protein [Acidobacteria bacterium]|nr:tetratricopeptide repeat protein [Acidobacteriota bacterium]
MPCAPFCFVRRLSVAVPPLALLTFALLLVPQHAARAQSQGMGAHRGDIAGSTGGKLAIQGRIISPTGRLPETRIRVTLEHPDSASRTATADSEGSFNFSNLEGGTYRVTIDAGEQFEIVRESVYLETQPTFTLPVYLRLKPEANPALAGMPKPALELFDRGLESARKGDHNKAIGQLNEAVALHPQFGLAHNELGLLYLKTNQLEKALESFSAANKALPEDASVQLNYGMALLEKKDYVEAEKQLRRSAKKLDKSPQAHLYHGATLMRQKKLDEAEKELQQSVKLSGGQVGLAHKYLGGIYWARQDLKRAADELEKYLKLSPKAPDAEQIRGTIKDLRAKS